MQQEAQDATSAAASSPSATTQKESTKKGGGGGGGGSSSSKKAGMHNVGEIVYAVDNGNVYEAKVLMVQHEGSLWKYFIHFQGWSRKFDVWVDESALAKTDDMAAIERLKDSAKLVIVTTKKGKKKGQALGLNDIIPGAIVEGQEGDEDGMGGAGGMAVDGEGGGNGYDVYNGEDGGTGVGGGKAGGGKRRNSGASSSSSSSKKAKMVVDAATLAKQRKMIAASDMFDMEDDGDIDPHTRIPIPIGLKKHLVDEWGLITQDPKKLIQLPRPINAQTVVKEYLDQKLNKVEGDQLERYQDLFQVHTHTHTHITHTHTYIYHTHTHITHTSHTHTHTHKHTHTHITHTHTHITHRTHTHTHTHTHHTSHITHTGTSLVL